MSNRSDGRHHLVKVVVSRADDTVPDALPMIARALVAVGGDPKPGNVVGDESLLVSREGRGWIELGAAVLDNPSHKRPEESVALQRVARFAEAASTIGRNHEGKVEVVLVGASPEAEAALGRRRSTIPKRDERLKEVLDLVAVAIDVATLLPIDIPADVVGLARTGTADASVIELLGDLRVRDQSVPVSAEVVKRSRVGAV